MLSLARFGISCMVRQAKQSPALIQAAVFTGLEQNVNKIQIRTRYNPTNMGIPFPKDGIEETHEEFDARYVKNFEDPKLDGWLCRKHMNDLCGFDQVPEPKIIIAAMKACRRLNDHSLAVRFIEAVYAKAAFNKEISAYIRAEIGPTLKELGISSPEELGYDEPELALGCPHRGSMIEQAEHK